MMMPVPRDDDDDACAIIDEFPRDSMPCQEENYDTPCSQLFHQPTLKILNTISVYS